MYITKSEVEQYTGLSIDQTLTTFINTLIDYAEEWIEIYCGGGQVKKRYFDDDDTEKTRYYDGNDLTSLKIDDLRSITSLTVDGVALTEDTDYYLYPLNASDDDEPYLKIQLAQPETRVNNNSRVSSSSPYIFDKSQKSVEVTGKFGYSTEVPSAVKVAALRIVGEVIRENIGDNDIKNVTQETIGDYGISYSDVKETAIRKKVGEALAPFVRRSINKKSGVFIAE